MMSDILSRVKKVTAEVLEMDPGAIADSARFGEDLGGDSVRAAEWIAGIEAEFDIEIGARDAMAIRSIGDAVEAVKKASGQ